MAESQLFLGVDAGGTKTHALVATSKGQILGRGHAGCGNWEGVGLEAAGAAIKQAVEAALAQAGAAHNSIAASGFGLAGLDWPSDEGRLGALVASIGLSGPQVLVNDAFVALAAGAPSGYGIAVIAGTGSVVAGYNRAGERWRTFGSGQIWGDTGGAYDLVARALRAVAHAHYGVGPATILTERFVTACGARNLLELVERSVREPRSPIHAGLAPLVTAAANEGDGVACHVLNEIGAAIGATAAAATRNLHLGHEQFDLVLAGSVLGSNCPPLIDPLLETVRAVAPRVRPVLLRAPPVLGGVVLAMQSIGINPDAMVRAQLEATLI